MAAFTLLSCWPSLDRSACVAGVVSFAASRAATSRVSSHRFNLGSGRPSISAASRSRRRSSASARSIPNDASASTSLTVRGTRPCRCKLGGFAVTLRRTLGLTVDRRPPPAARRSALGGMFATRPTPTRIRGPSSSFGSLMAPTRSHSDAGSCRCAAEQKRRVRNVVGRRSWLLPCPSVICTLRQLPCRFRTAWRAVVTRPPSDEPRRWLQVEQSGRRLLDELDPPSARATM